jgi:hypothetical protein
MATTGDAPLNLTKPEASDVVSLSVINTNYDTINSNAAAVESTLTTHTSQISSLNTVTGAGGAVVKATNIAGGTAKRIPIQSSANNTTFIPESEVGKLLIGTSTPPYAAWGYPVPYKMAAGIILAADFTAGVSSAVDLTSYGFTQAPVVVVSPVYAGMNTLYVTSVSSTPSASSFVVRQRLLSSGSDTVAAPTTHVAVHWTAVQLVP